MEREEDRSWADELDGLLKRRNAHEQRKAVLEEQRAQYGRATPAHIVTEIKEIEAKILDLNNQIHPIEVPKFLDRMSEIERSKYNTALVMGLQAAFVENRSEQRRDTARLRRDFRRLIVVVATLNLVGLARPTMTWHVWLLVGLTVAILAGVALEMLISERRK